MNRMLSRVISAHRARRGLLPLAILAATALPGTAQVLVVDLPEIQLLPNTPGQQVSLFVQNNSGSDVNVTGLNFVLQVADGGPEAGGAIDGPTITGIDVLTDTHFELNNDGQTGTSVFPQVFEAQTITDSGEVAIPAGSSKFATVTFDTTGFNSGNFSYTVNYPGAPFTYTTTGADIFPQMIDGTITVVPEPSTYAAFAGMGCLAFGFLFRRVRGRASCNDC